MNFSSTIFLVDFMRIFYVADCIAYNQTTLPLPELGLKNIKFYNNLFNMFKVLQPKL